MPSIANQSVLILGGSSGIGFAVAKLALTENLRVAIASSNLSRVNGAVKRLRDLKGVNPDAISGHVVDLSHKNVENNLEKLLDEVTATCTDGKLDQIIMTAGDAIDPRKLADIDTEYIAATASVRFLAPLILAKMAPRYVKNHWTSCITITGGRVAEKPVPGFAVAACYAAGLRGMVKSLALELRPIRVNLVEPGAVMTELWGPNPEKRASTILSRMALGKVGAAEEAAEAYLYFIKDTNATGSVVTTNAGELLL